jgi:hypothetical protein
MKTLIIISLSLIISISSCKMQSSSVPSFKLIPAENTIYFKAMVDCNMAEAWIKDTFRIFSGKYGEDPVWGHSDALRFASGSNADSVFNTEWAKYEKPSLPPNAGPYENGLHGAVWFETVYKDSKDSTDNTLYSLYHNENYPANFPFREETGEGYSIVNWPVGLLGDTTEAAVCRIGIMKSTDAGRTWVDKGIILEDKQPRMILKPDNTSVDFAGGVGDPSAVVSGDYLYIFYSEYGYPGNYNEKSYDPVLEWAGQCISVARIPLKELDNPAKKARRWDGHSFNVSYDGVGKPIKSLQIPLEEGGGPTSSAKAKYYWGPSVSWNTYLQSWVMLMARAEAPKWEGSAIFISFNKNPDLGKGSNSQDWSEPQLLLEKKGDVIWYPSLQPTSKPEDIRNRYTCLRMGKRARLYYKYFPKNESDRYLSEYEIEFLLN